METATRPAWLGESNFGEARAVLDFLSSLEGATLCSAQESIACWCLAEGARAEREELAFVALRHWPRKGAEPSEARDSRVAAFLARGSNDESDGREDAPDVPDAEVLYSDLPLFQRLALRPCDWTDEKLVREANRARMNRLVASASHLEISGCENIATLVRVARTARLMVWVVQRGGRPTLLVGSSARAHSRHFLEGRGLCADVSRALSFDGARIDVFLGEGTGVFRRLLAGDPVGTKAGIERSRMDSELERKIEKWLRRKEGIQWTLVREASALEVENHLFFPDFRLTREADGTAFDVEVVGFWTEQYLTRKIALAKKWQGGGLVFLLDAALLPKSDTAKLLAQEACVFVFGKKTKPETFFEWLESKRNHA